MSESPTWGKVALIQFLGVLTLTLLALITYCIGYAYWMVFLAFAMYLAILGLNALYRSHKEKK